MKNLAFFLIFSVSLLCTLFACKKEQNKKELLSGQWNVTSALKSPSEFLVYDNENARAELTLDFSEPSVTWEEKVTVKKDTGVTHIFLLFGNYSWSNDNLEVSFFPSGSPEITGTAEVAFPSEDDLEILFHLSDNTGAYTVDMIAKRR